MSVIGLVVASIGWIGIAALVFTIVASRTGLKKFLPRFGRGRADGSAGREDARRAGWTKLPAWLLVLGAIAVWIGLGVVFVLGIFLFAANAGSFFRLSGIGVVLLAIFVLLALLPIHVLLTAFSKKHAENDHRDDGDGGFYVGGG